MDSIETKFQTKPLGSARGFTLIEMVVTVALVGILVSLAIPQYKNFRARGIQVEAKATLNLMFSAEKTFAAEKFSFTTCLRQAGFRYDTGGQIYYSAGFLNSTAGNTCGPLGTSYCGLFIWTGAGVNCFLGVDTATFANIGMNGSYIGADTVPESSTVTRSTFIIYAGGDVGSNAFFDEWTIDQNKTLSNVVSGL